MNFIQRVAAFFRGNRVGLNNRYLTVYVLSRRCKEPIAGQVDLLNELSQSEESGYSYYTRKVFHTSGANRCFGQVEVTLHFDGNKQIVEHTVQGGDWLSEAEYEEELARFNAPPADDETDDEEGAHDAAEDVTPAPPAPSKKKDETSHA